MRLYPDLLLLDRYGLPLIIQHLLLLDLYGLLLVIRDLLLLNFLHLNLRPSCYRKEQRQGKHDPEEDRKKPGSHALLPSI